jgi:phosphatidylserine/phosphatidylglycerophosphate/cardiolipin synthase-like enzyme
LAVKCGLAVLAALAAPAHATSPDAQLEIHYSPEERLDRIDAALIATARTSIDLASYSLTDPVVVDALNAAARRGVKIRIVLDPRERQDFVRLGDLADTVRIKRGGPYMHFKSYEIDGLTLRTGSANFSASGENAQDNDLISFTTAAVRRTRSRPIPNKCGRRRLR